MNLHEYQAKHILKKYGVNIPEGIIAFTPEDALNAANQLHSIQDPKHGNWVVIKAQIHAGGRGKGGGVKLAKNMDDVQKHTENIIGMNLVTPQTSTEGKKVRMVLVQEDIYYPGESEIREFYMSILLNRQTKHNMVVYSPRGGMDIEQVSEETPELIFHEEINPAVGIQEFQCRKIAFNLGLSGDAFKEMTKFIPALYKAYFENDASLIEINPFIKTSDNRILAVDAKVTIDNNALFRHPEIFEMRDINEEEPMDVEAGKFGLNFIKLNGNVGCMVNGAGLAMATMDIIKLSGGEPANFLDVGGSANAKRVEEAFKIILKDSNVKIIFVNIFGGIVRCDRVAEGIIEAYKNLMKINIPIIIRLQGTNAVEAKKIIDDSGLKVYSVIKLREAADLISTLI